MPKDYSFEPIEAAQLRLFFSEFFFSVHRHRTNIGTGGSLEKSFEVTGIRLSQWLTCKLESSVDSNVEELKESICS